MSEYERLDSKWIDEHEYIRMDPDNPFVYVKDLQNLLVPKREVLTDEQIARKVDRAYKDGYEKGKEHATEKQSEETETVARVLVDYLIASAKLKLVLSMEVEELEE